MSDRPNRESWLAQPPRQRDDRYSMSSFASQASYDPSEIGEAVSVPVQEQRGDLGEVKQMYVGKDDGSTADEESLFSESQAQLGRLDTIKRKSQIEIQPEVSVQTELKETVPPRLRRRPVSEITPRGETATQFSKTHHPRVSINISDDLDKLMASASDLKRAKTPNEETRSPVSISSSSSAKHGLSPEKISLGASSGRDRVSSGGSIEKSSSGALKSSGAKGKVQHMNFSTDSFETAEDYNPLESSDYETQRFALPKRPNEDNMRKARQASANQAIHAAYADSASLRSRSNTASSLERTTDFSQSNQTLRREDSTSRIPVVNRTPVSSVRMGSASSRYLSDSDSQVNLGRKTSVDFRKSLERNFEDEPLAREFSDQGDVSNGSEKVRSSGNEYLGIVKVDDRERTGNISLNGESDSPRNESVYESHKSQNDESPLPGENAQISRLIQAESTPLTALENPSHGEPIHSLDDMNSNDLELGSTESIRADLPDATSILKKSDTDDIAKAELLKKQLSIERQEVTDYAHNDDFYDIEEPVLLSNTVRAKSVRENTRKGAKRKSKHIKNRESAGRLKPFSYNTLVHLLESINGSVIGEEFELLHLPMREKQLIEKIVDLLSRLTLDMVIDENRYEVGIDRLERAHRVLEGFL